MKSIQTKFGMVITLGLLLMALLVGGFSVWNTNKIIKQNSDAVVTSKCNQQALRLNQQLQLIENSVSAAYNIAELGLTSVDELADSQFREEYMANVEKLVVDIGMNTQGVLGVYLRLAPEIVQSGTEGFYWVTDEADGELHAVQTTDILDDADYTDWYYFPVEKGKPVWMDPYYNENINTKMISYSLPMYKDGVLFGVVGMDISLALFVDIAQDVTLYESGRADLIDMNQKLIYYSMDDEDGDDILSSEITDVLYRDLSASETNGDTLMTYSTDDGNVKMAYQTLVNGMKFVIYAPVREIDEERNQQIVGIIELTVLVVIIFWIFTLYMCSRIIRPLKELNLAAQRLTQGEWDVEIKCSTNDEVRELTDSIMTMASQLKEDMEQMNALAFKDGLTGVRNQAFYKAYVNELKEQIANGDAQFAVGVFDVNGLKQTNDTFGHEFGDRLIKLASELICEVFAHSPVFRIGGDEFAVILQNHDYERRNLLFDEFVEKMNRTMVDSKRGIRLSVAYGLVCYTKETKSYEALFQEADDAMYAKKKEMKKRGFRYGK